MNSLHLFAGIGGGILADKILGNRIVGAVEIEPYCRAVLKQRQEEGIIEKFPIFEDIRNFKGNEIKERIDLVCGGFPCQNISYAGRGKGINGEKSRLFYELIRVCWVIKPQFIFLENSPAITRRGLEVVLKEIAKIGYNAEWTCLSARQCGAPHKRERWWCLCERAERFGDLGLQERWGQPERRKDNSTSIKTRSFPDPDSMGRGARRNQCTDNGTALSRFSQFISLCSSDNREKGWWEVEPDVGRVAYGLSNGVDRIKDRIKGLGNAQVPVCAALAFYILIRRLKEYDTEN